MAKEGLWQPVIGLEIHLRLETKSKIFAPEAMTYNEAPNSFTSEITLAEPGALPGINKKAVDSALKMALMCNCKMAEKLVFDRKSYFYPDLPKGYQITQYRHPLGQGGEVRLSSGEKIALESIHLEEDSAKTTQLSATQSGLDFNRAGMPLIEIVTAPCITNEITASGIIKEIARMAKYLGISQANLEKGSLRCDANVSLTNLRSEQSGMRTEIKNLNSYSQIRLSLAYEINRHKKLLEKGIQPETETRTFDASKNITVPMRHKESAESYRYFPELDLLPVTLHKSYLRHLSALLPERPSEKRMRYNKEYNLSDHTSEFITDTPERADFFEELAKHIPGREAATWIAGPIQAVLKQKNLEIKDTCLRPSEVKKLITQIEKNNITREKAESELLPVIMEEQNINPEKYIEQHNLKPRISTEDINNGIEKVFGQYPEECDRLKKGEKKLLGFFIGQLNKELQNQTDPRIIRKHLMDSLERKK